MTSERPCGPVRRRCAFLNPERHWAGFLGLMCLASLPTNALDWPQFRGPNGDGTTSERIRTNWNASTPRRLWTATLTDGFSSLAVSGGKLYTLVKRSVGGQSQEVCIALEADTGREVWARALGKALYDPGGNEGAPGNTGGDGPRSTPTARGDRVFVYSAQMVLSCLSVTDGRVVWSRDLMAEFGAREIVYQNAASPMVENDLVIVNCNAPNKTFLALKASDGSVAWQGTTEDRLTQATPLPVTVLGMRQVIFYTQGGLVSVNPTNGAVVWRHKTAWPDTYLNVSAAASPVVHDNLVYASGGYNVGARVVRVTKSGASFTATQTQRKSGELESHWATPVQLNGYLYGIYGTKQYATAPLKCVKLDTLEERWSQDDFGPGGVILVNGQLVVLTDAGQLVLVQPNPSSYVELARFQAVSGKCWNVPAVSNGRIFVRSTKAAAAYDVSLPPPPPVRLQPLVLAGGSGFELRVTNADGTALDPARTNQLGVWTAADPGSPLTQWSRLTNPWIWEDGVLRFQTTLGPERQHYFRTIETP